jgi:hypothetical protein
MTTNKAAAYAPTEDLNDATTQAQVNALAAWVAANPTAVITPIAGKLAEGGLPAYLRRDHGKRADINRRLAEGITVAEFLAYARPLGGGYVDLVAAVHGGYSRSANGYGKPYVNITK